MPDLMKKLRGLVAGLAIATFAVLTPAQMAWASTSTTVRQWDTTAANNDDADTGINWAEGQDPGTVNNSARAMMAALARLVKDQGGALIAGGTSTALTVTTNSLLEAAHIANGLAVKVRTASAATGAATIAFDGLTAVDIKRNDGTAIVSGSWASGAILDLVYSSTASAFIAANIPGASSTPAATASFRADKAGSNQSASAGVTQVTFGTEAFDTGGYFSSSAWTPPAGVARMTVTLTISAVASVLDFANIKAMIYKDGAAFAINSFIISHTDFNNALTLQATLVVDIVDQTTGSNVYTVYVSSNDDVVVNGATTESWFVGHMI